MYPSFKASVLGKGLVTVQGIKNPYGIECVTLDWAYAAALFPTVSISRSITLGNANTLFANANTAYFQKIVNDVNNPNQIPTQGDVMVFAGTPAPGYTNTFSNPYGHTGICDSATPAGYTLLQQNAPTNNAPVNLTTYPWRFRPCIGWMRPVITTAPPSGNVGKTVTLPANNTYWHTYNPDGPYDLAHAQHVLSPAAYGGLSYIIVADKGNGVYVIKTDFFGLQAIWTEGTNAVVS
jgi:hypothetical protein